MAQRGAWSMTTSRWRSRSRRSAAGLLVVALLGTAAHGGGPAGAADAATAAGERPGDPATWFVQVGGEPVAAMIGDADRRGASLGARQQRSARAELRGRQAAVEAALERAGAEPVSSLTDALNGIIVTGDAADVDVWRALPDVVDVRSVGTFEPHLDRTVPYVGASVVQELGFDGTGVTVAVLDSGIDYTHAALGGPGTREAYAAAARDPRARDGLFPTDKVIGGYDFVSNDDDPIDSGTHGTHVADIIAGVNGVAPGASLYALRVCNGFCPGEAILNAIEWSLDPNGDGDLSDRADIINLSLGSDFGRPTNPLAVAADNASKAGVVVVASAGNGGNVTGIVGSPSVGTDVIAVAQTTLPISPVMLTITAPESAAGVYGNTATLGWAPLAEVLQGEVVDFGRGCSRPYVFTPDPILADPAGKIALMRSGGCSWGMKIHAAANAGAVGVLIDYEEDPTAFGADPAFPDVVPALVITTSVGAVIRAATEPVRVTIDPSLTSPHVAAMAGTSSRGPVGSDGTIKPDLGAPGASVSAVAGTGTGTNGFGGTSGAAPMVAGAAALLLEALPNASPPEIKARLMGSAETEIRTGRETGLAPIARIGAGELRVDRALATTLYASDAARGTPSLSYGRVAPPTTATYQRELVVHNVASRARRLRVEVIHRYDDDRDSAVVVAEARAALPIRSGGTATIKLDLTVDPALLATAALSDREFDGYVRITDRDDPTQRITVPWLMTVLDAPSP
jgi:subtilisin family serine protease